MLNRLLDPTSGQILLDGNDITKMDKKHVRKHVGIILQEPFLYSRTIGKNINITLPYDDVKKASELARIASVDKDIESFDLKYETMVGERGVTLSGGQKQRISIARMLADKTKEIDEWQYSLYNDLLEEGVIKESENGAVFIKPYLFTAQKVNSTALSVTAGLLLCGNRNGWEYWKDQNGNPLNDDVELVKRMKKKK